MGLLTVSSRVATAGLVGLVALDVVLVGMALRSTASTVSDTDPVSSASIDSSGATESPSAKPSATTSTAPVTATATGTVAPAAPLRTMLAALDNQRAWRVSVGTCAEGGAKLVTTTDGGTTWTDAKAPLPMIVRVRPTDVQAAFVIGAGSSCAAEFQSTSDGGGTWASGSAVGSAWFRDPEDPRVVRAPGPATSQPCGARAVLDLAVLSTTAARVLCADGLLRSTADTASSWADSGNASGAVALAVRLASPAQTHVALVDAPGCAGVQIRRVDLSEATSCISVAVPKDGGQIALSLVDGGGWLAVGDTTMRSTDGLVTWSAS